MSSNRLSSPRTPATTPTAPIVEYRTDSVAEAEHWLAREIGDAPVPSVLVVIGLGHGHLLEALDRRGGGTRVIALEPDAETAKDFVARGRFTPWIETGRLTYLVDPAYAGADEAWHIFPGSPEAHALLVHPAVARSAGPGAVRAARVAKQIIFGAKANAEARARFAPRYLFNTLENLPVVVREADASALAGAFSRVPAIITAAGPSLDWHLETLAAVGDRALMIAVDTSLRPLLGAGIEPHLAVAIDPSEANARHLLRLSPCDKTTLVAEASMDPRVFEHFKGRTFVYQVSSHHPWPWLAERGFNRGRLRAWGSVLTTAFDLAVQGGCDPIVFVGADLAFTEYRPYCRGTVYEEGWVVSQQLGYDLHATWRSEVDARNPVEATDLHGQPTRSSEPLIAFRDWIVEQTTRLPGRRIVNASNAGILAGGRILQGVLADQIPATASVDLRAAIGRCYASTAVPGAGSALDRLIGDLETIDQRGLDSVWSEFTSLPAADLAARVKNIAATVRRAEGL